MHSHHRVVDGARTLLGRGDGTADVRAPLDFVAAGSPFSAFRTVGLALSLALAANPLRAQEAASAIPAPAELDGTCVVERITDGDTVACETGDEIRLLLIDAPEMDAGDYGLRSKLALEALLPVGTPAGIELDVEERDPFGRILAHLYTPEGVNVNLEMVRRGYAVVLVIVPNVRHADPFKAVAREARLAGRGLWELAGAECPLRDLRRGRCE